MKIFFVIPIIILIACLGFGLLLSRVDPSYPDETRFIGQWKYLYEVGIASWYGTFHHGMTMANGKPFDMYKLSIAHKSLPFGTKVRITNLKNGKQIDLVVTDRGPYYKGRIVDLSFAAASRISMVDVGIVICRVEIIRA